MNTHTPKNDGRLRVVDPSVLYDTPGALAADGALSVRERLELLQRWDFDVREHLVASGEGMRAARTSADLHEIAEAIAALTAQAQGAPTATPTQHGAFPSVSEAPDAGTAEGARARVSPASIPFGPRAAGARRGWRPARVKAALIVLGAIAVGLALAGALLQSPVPMVVGCGLLAFTALAAFVQRRGGAARTARAPEEGNRTERP